MQKTSPGKERLLVVRITEHIRPVVEFHAEDQTESEHVPHE